MWDFAAELIKGFWPFVFKGEKPYEGNNNLHFLCYGHELIWLLDKSIFSKQIGTDPALYWNIFAI